MTPKALLRRIVPTPVLASYRIARAYYRQVRKRAVFETIYRDNLWGDPESRSGCGSGLDATARVRAGLLDVLQRYNVHTLVDAPCGDFYWLSTLDLSRTLTWYLGLDIVPALIAANRRRFATDTIRFEAADLTKRVPPRADLIVCRHLLIHLTLDDCGRVLRNFRRSGSRYLLITNQPQTLRNEEILFTGSYRPINLALPPFTFPPPLWSIPDAQGPDDAAVAAVFDLRSITP